MSDHGDLYLVVPEGDDDDSVETYEGAKMFLDVAPELLRLAGRDVGASWLETLVGAVWERDPALMTAKEMAQLAELLNGLEEALVGSVVDGAWKVPPERLPELRARVTHIEIGESRGPLAVHGVGEAMANVGSLRSILREALERGLVLAFQ